MLTYRPTEALDPLCLKWGYNLKDEELADLLGLQPRAIRHYSAGKRSPSPQIKMLAAFIHREFQRRGIPLVNPDAIKLEALA
jgi:hypothetical protein